MRNLVRELESVNRLLNIVGKNIHGKSVDWHTDRKIVRIILAIEVGSRKPHLHRSAQEIQNKSS